MAKIELVAAFQDAKETLCQYDYYIHIPKRILHVTNSERKLPHLMGMQYLGAEKFTGESGVYLIKKKRLRRSSIEKIVRKIYKRVDLQDSILAMIESKVDHIARIKDMFSNYSDLYLYDAKANPESEFETDYLLVYETSKEVFQLGLVKSAVEVKDLYHCNSFIITYTKNQEYDRYYRNLKFKYPISKVIREDKLTKQTEVIYQSEQAILRETSGIQKMLSAADIEHSEKLIKTIRRLNVKFGKYHTLEMLNDRTALLSACSDSRQRKLVEQFLKLWNAKE